jgi:hypothetical protein
MRPASSPPLIRDRKIESVNSRSDEGFFSKLLEENWAKHGVRFAASSGERYSAVWLAFSRGSEFYLGARSALGSLKISLHKRGECRLAIPNEHLPQMVKQGLEAPPQGARALVTWRRPTDVTLAPLVVRLIFPTDYLHPSITPSSKARS